MSGSGPAKAISITLLVLVAYFFAISALGCAKLAGSAWRNSKWARFFGGLCGILFPLAPLVATACLLRRRKFAAALLGVGAAAGMAVHELSNCRSGESVYIVAVLLTVLSFGTIPSGRKLRKWMFIPLVILGLYLFSLWLYGTMLDREIAGTWKDLDRLAGHNLAEASFLEREEQGLALDSEPLKSLLAADLDRANMPDWAEYGSAEELRKDLALYKSANMRFVKALEEFLGRDPRRIRHRYRGDLGQMSLPELGLFRRSAAPYLGCESIAADGDRTEILKRQKQFAKLRDWALASDEFAIAIQTGISLEHTRINVLARALGAGTLTGDDFRILSHGSPDWDQIQLRMLAGESMIVRYLYQKMMRGDSFGDIFGDASERKSLDRQIARGTRFMPLEFPLLLRRDYARALDYERRSFLLLHGKVFRSKSGSEKKRIMQEMLDAGEFVFFKSIHSVVPYSNISIAEVKDARLLADTAFQVELFRRKYGKLPEKLEELVPEFLPEVPLDNLNHLPIKYTRWQIRGRKSNTAEKRSGYRLYTCDADGKDAGGTLSRNKFTVVQ